MLCNATPTHPHVPVYVASEYPPAEWYCSCGFIGFCEGRTLRDAVEQHRTVAEERMRTATVQAMDRMWNPDRD